MSTGCKDIKFFQFLNLLFFQYNIGTRHINIKLPIFLLSINAHCIYNLQGYAYGYTFVCRRMCNFSFDSYHISKSLLNLVVAVVFVFYSELIQFGSFCKLKEFTIVCAPAKKEQSVSRFGHPIIEYTYLSIFQHVSMLKFQFSLIQYPGAESDMFDTV